MGSMFMPPYGIMGRHNNRSFILNRQRAWSIAARIDVLRMSVVAGLLAGIDNPIWGLGSWPNIGEYMVEATDIAGKGSVIMSLNMHLHNVLRGIQLLLAPGSITGFLRFFIGCSS